MSILSRRQLLSGISVAALTGGGGFHALAASPSGNVQINSTFLYRGNNFPFINVAKTADRPWQGARTGDHDVYELLDDNSMPKGKPIIGFLQTAIDLFTLAPGDRWVVDWTGVAGSHQLTLGVPNGEGYKLQTTTTLKVNNRLEYSIVSGNGAPRYSVFLVQVNLSDNSSINPVQNLRIYRKSDEKIALVSGATPGKNGTVRLTVNSTAGMESGDNCYVTDVEGTTEANGCRQMTVINGTNLELQGTTFSHAWISGGTVRYLDAVHYFMPEFLAVFKGFGRFRFTQWQQIIGSTVANWSDRTTKPMMSWYGENIIGSHYIGVGRLSANDYTSMRARNDDPSEWTDGMTVRMRWNTAPAYNAITGFSRENPAKVTAVGHGFSTGDIVFFQPGSVGAMSNKIGYTLAFYAITVVDVDNFTLNGVDSSAWPAYTGGGIVAKQIRVKAGNLPFKRVVSADGGVFYVEPLARIVASHPLVTLTYDATFDALLFSQVGAGMPLEVMVDLSNELNIHPWFCIPHMADDDYVTRMATYIRDQLNSDLIASFELSNEVWNGTPGYSETGYASAQAILRWGNNITGASFQSNAWYGWRFYNVMKIISDVFKGQSSRVNRVMAEWTTAFQKGPNDVTPRYRHGKLTGRGGDLTPVAPITLADSIAIAPYLEGDRRSTANTQYVWDYVYSGDAKLQAAALAWLDSKMREDSGHSQQYFKKVVFPAWAAMRDSENSKYGINLALTCYEGGPGLIPSINTIVGPNPINGHTIVVNDVLAFFKAYYESDHCKQLMTDWLNDFAAVGGVYPAQYPLTGFWGTSGMFGLRVPNEFGQLIGAETALRQFNGNAFK